MCTLVALVSKVDTSEVRLVLEQLGRNLVPACTWVVNILDIVLDLCCVQASCLVISDCALNRRLELHICIGANTHVETAEWWTRQDLVVDCLIDAQVSRDWEQHWSNHALAIQCECCIYPSGWVSMVGEGEGEVLLVLNEWGDIHLIPFAFIRCEVCTSCPIEWNSIQTWVARDFWCWRYILTLLDEVQGDDTIATVGLAEHLSIVASLGVNLTVPLNWLAEGSSKLGGNILAFYDRIAYLGQVHGDDTVAALNSLEVLLVITSLIIVFAIPIVWLLAEGSRELSINGIALFNWTALLGEIQGNEVLATVLSKLLVIDTFVLITNTIVIVVFTEGNLDIISILTWSWRTWSDSQVQDLSQFATIRFDWLVRIITSCIICHTIPCVWALGCFVVLYCIILARNVLNCSSGDLHFTCSLYIYIYVVVDVQLSQTILCDDGLAYFICIVRSAHLCILTSYGWWSIVATSNESITSLITIIIIWNKLDTYIIGESHILSLVIQALPVLTILEDDIYIITCVGICPEVTLLNSWVLCTFATSWPYPNVDLIGPSSRYFGINRNLTVWTVDYRICSFITIDISSDLDASVLAECHIFSLVIQTLPALTILEDDIHIITSMGVGPKVAFLSSYMLRTWIVITPYPNVDLVCPISRYDCFDCSSSKIEALGAHHHGDIVVHRTVDDSHLDILVRCNSLCHIHLVPLTSSLRDIDRTTPVH